MNPAGTRCLMSEADGRLSNMPQIPEEKCHDANQPDLPEGRHRAHSSRPLRAASAVGIHSRTRPPPGPWTQRYHHGRRNRRWRPSGDASGALPRLLVVGDAGEPATQFNRGREFTILLIGGADRGGIGFSDNKHGPENGGVGRGRQASCESRYHMWTAPSLQDAGQRFDPIACALMSVCGRHPVSTVNRSAFSVSHWTVAILGISPNQYGGPS